MNKLLVICGPTSVGKTALAVRLARQWNGELVGADSRHVYKGLDVLTGKDIPSSTRIWMTDVVEPREEFSVAHYVKLGRRIVDDIWKRKKLPIVVGGTGLYIDALVGNFGNITIPRDKELREELSALPLSALQEKVSLERLQSMNESDRKNPRRLMRAIEIAKWQRDHLEYEEFHWKDFEVLRIGLYAPMKVLERRIRDRIINRWEKAVGEVRLPHIKTALGVREIERYFKGVYTKEEAQEAWFRAERSYAKRQMTWFKKQKYINWFSMETPDLERRVRKLVQTWYTHTTHE